MQLSDLKGRHVLSGVDFSEEEFKDYCGDLENSNVCRFRLDGVVYSAVEDPVDGYRSCMRDLFVSESGQMKNTFPDHEVVGRYIDKDGYDQCDILELIDVETGNVVLRIGTESTDDYYPYFVAEFVPESLSVND